MMGEDYQRHLPPRREVDHNIELDPGVKPPTYSLYCTDRTELEDLRKKLKELLEVGHNCRQKDPMEC